MDITLERMLSLIPKKSDGKFVHGAKKEFADKIGVDNTTITQWISGASKSYKRYVSSVSLAYDVSVGWLLGETDDPRSIRKPEAQINPVAFIKDLSGSMTNEELLETLRVITDALGKGQGK